MTLNEWMQETKTPRGEVADFLGCDPSYVSKLRAGATPSLQVANQIAILTDGLVSFEDWLPAIEEGQPAGSPAKPTAPTEQT